MGAQTSTRKRASKRGGTQAGATSARAKAKVLNTAYTDAQHPNHECCILPCGCLIGVERFEQQIYLLSAPRVKKRMLSMALVLEECNLHCHAERTEPWIVGEVYH